MKTILLPLKGDALDEYREEYNRMLLEKATGANSIIQEKYITISVCKKNVEEARNYFCPCWRRPDRSFWATGQ